MSDFKTMNEIVQSSQKPAVLAYCDRIAHTIAQILPWADIDDLSVGRVKSDLHPTQGYLLTTQKTIEVEHYGKKYLITVMEVL